MIRGRATSGRRALHSRAWTLCIAALVGALLGCLPAIAAGADAPAAIVASQLIHPGEPTSLRTTFDVRSRGTDPIEATGWRTPDGYLRSPQVAAKSLADGAIRRVEITFEEVSRPGLFEVDLSGLEGGARTVRLQATYQPRVEVSATDLSMQLSNCRVCWPTDLFAPGTRQKARRLQLRNPSPTGVVARISIAGSSAGHANLLSLVADDGSCAQTRDIVLPSDGQAIVDLVTRPVSTAATDKTRGSCRPGASPAGPEAGEYPARVIVTALPATGGVADAAVPAPASANFVPANVQRQEVVTNIRVRDGAIPVILFVVAGVITGRILSRLNASGYRDKLALWGRLAAVRDVIERILNVGVRRQLMVRRAELLEQVTGLAIVDGTADSIAALEQQAGRALRAAELEALIAEALAAKPGDESLRTAKTAIEESLFLLLARPPEFDAAQAKYAQADTLLAAGSGAAPAADEAVGPNEADDAPKSGALEGRFVGWLHLLAGTGPSGVRTYYWLQALISLAFLVLLCLYGVWLHYGADTAATFGSQGLAGYATLFLWGLTSEVVTKTIQTITFTRPTS